MFRKWTELPSCDEPLRKDAVSLSSVTAASDVANQYQFSKLKKKPYLEIHKHTPSNYVKAEELDEMGHLVK
jgi:hypothetical protein